MLFPPKSPTQSHHALRCTWFNRQIKSNGSFTCQTWSHDSSSERNHSSAFLCKKKKNPRLQLTGQSTWPLNICHAFYASTPLRRGCDWLRRPCLRCHKYLCNEVCVDLQKRVCVLQECVRGIWSTIFSDLRDNSLIVPVMFTSLLTNNVTHCLLKHLQRLRCLEATHTSE